MLGSIEAGGTKIVCAVGNDDCNLIDKVQFPTTSPEEVIEKIAEFFNQYPTINGIGIGSFGPIDIDPQSKTYGYITSTPKDGWRNFDLLGSLKKKLDVPFAFTTDVNASAIGEYYRGAARGLSSCLYLTIGTGVGGGAIFDGKIFTGISHPEMGHVSVTRLPGDDFECVCPYHSDCFEGLSAGPAIEKRAGMKGVDIPKDHPALDLAANYIAQALIDYTIILRVEKIIIGGGLMHKEGLMDKVKKEFTKLLNDYVTTPPLDKYIVTPGLGNDSGIIGGLLLARECWEESLY